MRIRNTGIIRFNLTEKKATLQINPRKKIVVDSNTLIAHKYATGWHGYRLLHEDEHGKKTGYDLSTRIVRQIAKYFEYTHQDFNFDYYRLPFEKFHFNTEKDIIGHE